MANQKIFIIEDDVDILYGLSSELSGADFIIDSSEADEDMDTLVQHVLDFSPDYIILDLILPKLDGFEVLKKIKENMELTDVPVFIFTDLSDQDSRERSVGLGVDQYFLKDEFDIYNFTQKIKKIIDNKRGDHDLDLDDKPEFVLD